jgi:hypothetical protein
MTYSRRVDANHGEIRNGLRKAGFDVFDCYRLGEGFPDLLVAAHGRLVLLEVKMPGAKLTMDEAGFMIRFGSHVVHSVEEALECLT